MPCIRVYEVLDRYGDRIGLGVEKVKPEDISLVSKEDMQIVDPDMPYWRNDPSYFWAKRQRRVSR